MHTDDSSDDPMGLAAAYNSLAASNSYSLSKPPNMTALVSHPVFPSADAGGSDFSFNNTLQSPFLGSRQPAHHLPTPQSPHDISQYSLNLQPPVSYPHHQYFPQAPLPKPQYNPPEENRFIQMNSLQTARPEPSPLVSRIPLPHFVSGSRSTTPARDPPPIHHSDVNLATPTPTRPVHVLTMSPDSTGSAGPSIPSTLSSPFMAKASPAKSKTPTPAISLLADPQSMHGIEHSASGPGGEIERIRIRMLQEQIQAQIDAESRRPDYLKRHKRAEHDLASSEFPELDEDAGDLPGVGITESPVKGRRLKLFQETSEESFEESLMAGGYGLYRTTDWQRPSFLPEAAPPPSTSGSPVAESPQEAYAPPTEKEIRKRRRLEAFKKAGPTITGAKLVPIELEGMGRVIFDVNTTVEEPVEPPPPEPTPKKRSNRRRKKGAEGLESPLKGRANLPNEPKSAQPNWPDEEFPWKVRRDERTELQRVEEEERLRCIERFLDRDTDDEEDLDDEHVWTPIPEESTKQKAPRSHRSTKYFRGHARLWSQNNRADARAALLTKKSIRELQMRRNRGGDHDGILSCLCGEPDENREMVQCDACKRWFHLDCIGIMNVSELGPEEEPWFCEECVLLSTPPTAELPLSEPTFVPTDTGNGQELSAGTEDVPFFHVVTEESPYGTSTTSTSGTGKWRATPTTPVRGSSSSMGSAASTRSSWAGGGGALHSSSSRNGPVTPRQAQSAHAVRVWQHTPGGHGDEEDFDPSSTPSRGIKVQPFHTPKGGNLWSMRWANGPQTPSKRAQTRRHMARYDELNSGNSTVGSVSYDSFISAYDESPIRRVVGRTSTSERNLAEGRRLFLQEETEGGNGTGGFGKRRPEGSLGLLTSDLRRSDYSSTRM